MLIYLFSVNKICHKSRHSDPLWVPLGDMYSSGFTLQRGTDYVLAWLQPEVDLANSLDVRKAIKYIRQAIL